MQMKISFANLKNLFSVICGFRFPDSGFRIPVSDSGFWFPIPDSGFQLLGLPRNSQVPQERFDAILRDAELKLLDATIEALTQDEQQYKERCTTEKENLTAIIDAWRSSFQASEASTSIDADHFVASAKC